MSVGAALGEAVPQLRQAGVAAPGREARLLLAAAAGLEPATLFGWPERKLAPEAGARFAGLVERRCRREPLSRILGRREFWSLEFRVTPDTLDPRPDSETLVAAALAALPDRAAPLRLVDLGTGTGCLLLALLHELPAAWGLGLDRSVAAARVAQANAAALGLADRAAFAVGDWAAPLAGGFDGGFDLAVANPPYIASPALAALDPEVREHDPLLALDGGTDGLDAYRRLAPALAGLLRPDGIAALEIGAGQGAAVAELLAAAGLAPISTRADLAGIPRAVTARNRGSRK